MAMRRRADRPRWQSRVPQRDRRRAVGHVLRVRAREVHHAEPRQPVGGVFAGATGAHVLVGGDLGEPDGQVSPPAGVRRVVLGGAVGADAVAGEAGREGAHERHPQDPDGAVVAVLHVELHEDDHAPLAPQLLARHGRRRVHLTEAFREELRAALRLAWARRLLRLLARAGHVHAGREDEVHRRLGRPEAEGEAGQAVDIGAVLLDAAAQLVEQRLHEGARPGDERGARVDDGAAVLALAAHHRVAAEADAHELHRPVARAHDGHLAVLEPRHAAAQHEPAGVVLVAPVADGEGAQAERREQRRVRVALARVPPVPQPQHAVVRALAVALHLVALGEEERLVHGGGRAEQHGVVRDAPRDHALPKRDVDPLAGHRRARPDLRHVEREWTQRQSLHAAEGTSTSNEPESGTIQKRLPPTPTLTVYWVLRKLRAVKQVGPPVGFCCNSDAAGSGAVAPIACSCCSAACCAVCGVPHGPTP
eukprot:scaffold57144_cov66-Phaeocystis_antarctica.AAC.8